MRPSRRSATNLALRFHVVRTIAVFLVCALALVHVSFSDPGIQNVNAENGNPPCPGGCEGDTIPDPEPLVEEDSGEVLPWYYSLLMLAL